MIPCTVPYDTTMKLSSIRPITLLISKELMITAFLLLGVSFVVFLILFLSPGDPFSAMVKEEMMSGVVSNGVPEAWYSQYLSWLNSMLHGDFGTSTRSGLPVLREVILVTINTIYLTVGSMFVTLLLAVPIAVISARRGMTLFTWPATIFTYVVSALPVFWLGYIVIYISMHQFGLFPLAFGAMSKKFNWIYFLLPVFVLGVGNGTISEVVRYLRDEMERVFAEDYIRTARAKGASIWKHSFKEGFLIPITEIIASKISFILGGAIVVEQVFNWPGMGRMAWQAAQDRDYPLIMGITLMAAIIVRLGSLVQRVVHIIVNPRASQE
ncbi:MAG: ABC transporter permease [Desulfobacterales bacterium]|nr:ABC transporter permease [Desulfobacterales bacterium]